MCVVFDKKKQKINKSIQDKKASASKQTSPGPFLQFGGY